MCPLELALSFSWEGVLVASLGWYPLLSYLAHNFFQNLGLFFLITPSLSDVVKCNLSC